MTKQFFSAVSKVAIAGCCAVLLMTSCKKDEPSAVSSVTLDETSLLLYVGQTHDFVATVLPSDASNKAVSWASSDPSVASVSESGELKALQVGESTVTVTTLEGEFTATCEVMVLEPMVPVESVTIEPTSITLMLRETKQLTATVYPEDATVKDIEWSSSHPEVAEVTIDGQIVPVSVGQSVITATSSQGGKSATCVVTVDAKQYTVEFETNGGTPVASQSVTMGEKATAPETTKVAEGGLSAGLYPGVQDPEQASYLFGGWYSDPEFTTLYDFESPVNGNLKLYAKWENVEMIDLSSAAGSNNAVKAMNYLNGLADLAAPTAYTLILDGEVWSKLTLNKANVELYIVGKDKECGIQSSWDDRVVVSTAGHLFLGNNIYVKATGDKASQTVLLDGGNLTMLPGSKIKDCDVTSISNSKFWPVSARTIVYLNNANSVFTLAGGEIVNNKLHCTAEDYMAGTICINNGKVVIESGKIADNTVTSDAPGIALCGGVYAPNAGSIDKTGGVIENNTATFTQTAIASGAEVRHVGQQMLFRAVSQYWEGTDPYKGAFKIDQNLSETDVVSTSDLSNPLWIRLNYKD